MFGSSSNNGAVLLTIATGFFVCTFALVDAFAPIPLQHPQTTTLLWSSTTSGTAPVLKSQLKKPSKVLTVGVEYKSDSSDDSDDNLEVFSMKLRQQAKVSFVACGDLDAIRLLATEQETAKGNFPGPLPIVYYCSGGEGEASASDVAEAGASALVVLGAGEGAKNAAEAADAAGLETIWSVSSAGEAEEVLSQTEGRADVFWLEGSEGDTNEIVSVLPKSSMAIGVVSDPMQTDGAEIEEGKSLKASGCASVVVKEACIGDAEDIEYASFVVGGLTSKASSEFKFSGLTGSTNGHFGGIQSNSSVRWERQKRKEEAENSEDDEK